jgi:DNA-binding protein H-NS
MPASKLKNMDAKGLLRLRAQLETELEHRRAEIETQLVRLDQVTSLPSGRGQESRLKGRKVPPKYRSPSGETWSGRGARPRWLVAALKGGNRLEKFLIDKPTRQKTKMKKRSKAVRRVSRRRGKVARRGSKARAKARGRSSKRRLVARASGALRTTTRNQGTIPASATPIAQLTNAPLDGSPVEM